MLQKEGVDATIGAGVWCLPELGCSKEEVLPELGVDVLPTVDGFATRESTSSTRLSPRTCATGETVDVGVAAIRS
jgi:hypothetical protein